LIHGLAVSASLVGLLYGYVALDVAGLLSALVDLGVLLGSASSLGSLGVAVSSCSLVFLLLVTVLQVGSGSGYVAVPSCAGLKVRDMVGHKLVGSLSCLSVGVVLASAVSSALGSLGVVCTCLIVSLSVACCWFLVCLSVLLGMLVVLLCFVGSVLGG